MNEQDTTTDPTMAVRTALRDDRAVDRRDVAGLLAAHDHRGRVLDAQRAQLARTEPGADLAAVIEALPDDVLDMPSTLAGRVDHLAAQLRAARAALVRADDRHRFDRLALEAHARREAEYVDRLADKVPSPYSPLADQLDALSELRQLLAGDPDADPDARMGQWLHMGDLADQVAVEFGHYTGLRRRWQRDHNENAAAWAALPSSVQGDAAPDGATLADRIRAVVMERDQARNGWRGCHHRHLDVEAAARAVLADLPTVSVQYGDPVAEQLHDTLERHRATGDVRGADHPSRSMPRHVEIVESARALLSWVEQGGPGGRAVADRLRAALTGPTPGDTGPPAEVVNARGAVVEGEPERLVIR